MIDDPFEGVPVVDERVLDSPGVVSLETGVTVDTDDGFVYISQSFTRHLHAIHWLISTAIILLAVVTALTDWHYVTRTGHVLMWPEMLFIGLVIPGIKGAKLLWQRFRGFTGENKIPLDAIEAVNLTTIDIRWYMKTKRSIPTFVLRYRDPEETKRRRIRLGPRYEDEHLQTGIDAFKSAGLFVDVDGSARELL